VAQPDQSQGRPITTAGSRPIVSRWPARPGSPEAPRPGARTLREGPSLVQAASPAIFMQVQRPPPPPSDGPPSSASSRRRATPGRDVRVPSEDDRSSADSSTSTEGRRDDRVFAPDAFFLAHGLCPRRGHLQRRAQGSSARCQRPPAPDLRAAGCAGKHVEVPSSPPSPSTSSAQALRVQPPGVKRATTRTCQIVIRGMINRASKGIAGSALSLARTREKAEATPRRLRRWKASESPWMR